MAMAQPNIIRVLLDQCRADCFGCYGHPFIKTPHVDWLAARGVRFTQAFAQNPVCVPSRCSMLSGMYSHRVGVMDNEDAIKPDDALTTRVLHDKGYICSNIGKEHFGIPARDIGFDQSEDILTGRGCVTNRLPDNYPANWPVLQFNVEGYPRPIIYATEPVPREETYTAVGVDQAIEQIKSLPRPFFLRLSINRPHTPVSSPSPYDKMYREKTALPDFNEEELKMKPSPQRNQYYSRKWNELSSEELLRIRYYYYGLVSHIDYELGRLFSYLEESRQMRDTLIIFVADHGCMLGEHGLQVKGPHCYTQTNLVPLIISYPEKLPQGLFINELVELVDILPTICVLCGLDVPREAQGRSLLPVILGEKPGKATVFSEGLSSKHRGARQTVRTKRWRYTRYTLTGEDELYNLINDPEEKISLAKNPEYRRIIKKMNELIDKWLICTM